MARATTLLLAVSLGLLACDTASEHEGCVDPNDPSKPGSDPSQCARSTFADLSFRALEISGIVRRGEDPVIGASVRAAPSPFTSTLASLAPVDSNTDVAGFYRFPGAISARYDLTFKLPGGINGREDMLVYRGVAGRYVEPQLDVPVRQLVRSFIGKIDVRLDTPLAEGIAVRFLASGDGIAGATGDLVNGVSVHMSSFTRQATIHAIVYSAADGLNSATAYAKADVTADAGATKVVTLHPEPFIYPRVTPTFEVDPASAPGFVPGNVDVRIGVGRTSDALLVSIPWGTKTSIAPIPNQSFTYEVRGTRADGAISDSGETGFDIAGMIKVKFVAPPEVNEPADNATISAGALLRAVGPGVIEHVFEPVSTPGAGLRVVIATGPETPFPDAKAMGIETLTGTYTWTVKSFPTLPFVENLVGPDARRYKPFAISAPRSLVLR